MKQLDSGIYIFDSGYRGPCPKEEIDQMAYGLWMGYRFPDVNFFHVPNETGTKSGVQFVLKRQKMGVKNGVHDNLILTPGISWPYGVLELKRRDRTKSKVSQNQWDFGDKAVRDGGFAAIAYGVDELKKATLYYFGLME